MLDMSFIRGTGCQRVNLAGGAVGSKEPDDRNAAAESKASYISYLDQECGSRYATRGKVAHTCRLIFALQMLLPCLRMWEPIRRVSLVVRPMMSSP